VRSSSAVKALLVGAVIVALAATQPVLASTAGASAPGAPATAVPVTSALPTPTAEPTTEPTVTAEPTTEPTVTAAPTSPPVTSPPPTSAPPTMPPPAPPGNGLPVPIEPATVTPAVALDPAVTRTCRDGAGQRLTTQLALAQNAYNTAERIYQRLAATGGLARYEVAPALMDLAEATIKLTNLKYALAKCQALAGADERKACTAALLELNRVTALLAQRQLIVAVAQRYHDDIALRVRLGSEPQVVLDRALQRLEDAKALLNDALEDERDAKAGINANAERCGFMRYPEEPPTSNTR
jgi:hypothetical protein